MSIKILSFPILLLLFVFPFLAGCVQSRSAQATPTRSQEPPLSAGGLSVAQVRSTCESTTTVTPLSTPSSAPIKITHTPAEQPALIFDEPCSPLQDHALQELTEIISDGYHPPPMGKDDRHQGVDFSYYRRGERMSIEGVEIQSVFPGKIAASTADSFPFGNMVIVETSGENLANEIRQRFSIQPGESLYILYAHMLDASQVRLGDEVERCQSLGQVGKSGNAGVAHLHLEMRHGLAGRRFPVMAYYLAKNTPEERANYLLWATSGEYLHFNPMDLLLSEK